jgi:nucleoside-diphosphate kinase
VQRGLVGSIIQRLESRGYQLVGLKLVQVSQELAVPSAVSYPGPARLT